MTINEVRELSTDLLIGLGMFIVSIYILYVMFSAFQMSRKKETDGNTINKYLTNHLVIYPLVALVIVALLVFIIYIAILLQTDLIYTSLNPAA